MNARFNTLEDLASAAARFRAVTNLAHAIARTHPNQRDQATPATFDMARKTKEEALATRSRILDAAEHVFERQGVSGSSLQDIAQAAGVTRGAVYWHFQDKADVFNAMMARVCLPMEEAATRLGQAAPQAGPETTQPVAAASPRTAPCQAAAAGNTALAPLRQHLLGVFARVTDDAQVRRVFAVATQKVEYVAEMGAVRERHQQLRNQHVAHLARLLLQAQQAGHLAPEPSAQDRALGLHALMDGLIQNWMLEPAAFDLKQVGASAVDTYLSGMAGMAGTVGMAGGQHSG